MALHPAVTDITGQRFGSLVALEPAGRTVDGKVMWRTICDCGKEHVTAGKQLRSGMCKSCGCRRTIVGRQRRKYGAQSTDEMPLYLVWRDIVGRCTSPSHRGYKWYGGRGIQICEAWRSDFAAFREYVGEPPGPGYSIDRIDNHGHYEPGNLRWATRIEQARNTRSNRILTLGELSLPVSQWAELVGVGQFTIHQRLRKGWPVHRALLEPAVLGKNQRSASPYRT